MYIIRHGTKGNVWAVTSYGEDETKTNNTAASSTANMSGVFDLSGCLGEQTATFLKGGAAKVPAWHNGMADANTTASTKYVTLYEGTYDSCTKIGDAVKETSTEGSGSTSWNGDWSYFVDSNWPSLQYGGCYSNPVPSCGIFAYGKSDGYEHENRGFRAVLIPN